MWPIDIFSVARDEFKESPREKQCTIFYPSSIASTTTVAWLILLVHIMITSNIEKKACRIFFCLNPNFGKSIGQGGCMVGKSFVYALLDW